MLFKNKKIKEELERQKKLEIQKKADVQKELEEKHHEEELALLRRKQDEEFSRIKAERKSANPVNKYKFSEQKIGFVYNKNSPSISCGFLKIIT